MDRGQKTAPVRTTETSFEVIDAIVDLDRTRMKDVAEYVDLAPSTAHRHLRTLQKHGYVVKREGEYELSFKFLTLGGIARNAGKGYRMAEDAVEQLSKKTRERAQFVIEENGERVFLFRRVGGDAVRGSANIGKRGPLHVSAAGKALLAELPESEVRSIIDVHGLESMTENTITDFEVLSSELETIREQGYAVNQEESSKRFHAVASTVHDPDKNVLGALSVSGPAHRLTLERIENETVDIVRGIAQELELKIEYS